MKIQKNKLIRYIIWFNLFIGISNLYLYTNHNWYFNLVIGSINIGVWVFNRHKLFNRNREI